jgi:hypothetical protein
MTRPLTIVCVPASQYGATNPSQRRGLRCEELNPAAQSRIRKELVACLRYVFLVWMSTRIRSRWR